MCITADLYVRNNNSLPPFQGGYKKQKIKIYRRCTRMKEALNSLALIPTVMNVSLKKLAHHHHAHHIKAHVLRNTLML
ncbi:hypothetical protein [Chryseobacterium gleum]|uniref:hypothetical protein n=1 Tax=Chryseobacterium gleum TaxID=250 RepID=UPI0031E39829